MSAKSTPPRRKKKTTAPRVEPEPESEEEEELSHEMLALMERRSYCSPTNQGLESIVRRPHSIEEPRIVPLSPPRRAAAPPRITASPVCAGFG